MRLTDPAGTRLLAAFRADVLHGDPLPCTAIHPDDFMLRYFLESRHGHREQALVDYLRTGLSIGRAIERLLHWWFGDARDQVRLLDFASGYGRVTRHLVQHHAARQLWVSDIFPAAVDFQQRLFGVHGFVSTAAPEDLACDETFDCVVTSSLFSHLPEARFRSWLARLFALLRPGGLLLLSVHDLSLRPLMGKPPLAGGATASGGTFLFEPNSEIPELGGEEYGTTWVDEPFVRDAVATALDGAACLRLPRALSSFQDFYAVSREAPPAMPPQVAEPIGYLDNACRSLDGRAISLEGWAHDLNGPGLAAVEVRMDGALVARCAADHSRLDVAACFGEADLRSGWTSTVAAPSDGPLGGEAMISVQAVSTSGLAHLIHLGSVEGTDLGWRLAREVALRKRAEAQARDAPTVEADPRRAGRSRKLRDAWSWSKRTLGFDS